MYGSGSHTGGRQSGITRSGIGSGAPGASTSGEGRAGGYRLGTWLGNGSAPGGVATSGGSLGPGVGYTCGPPGIYITGPVPGLSHPSNSW